MGPDSYCVSPALEAAVAAEAAMVNSWPPNEVTVFAAESNAEPAKVIAWPPSEVTIVTTLAPTARKWEKPNESSVQTLKVSSQKLNR